MSAALRAIAAQLREAAASYPDTAPDRVPDKRYGIKGATRLREYLTAEMACFKFGTLTLRCLPHRECVLRMAAKLEASGRGGSRVARNSLAPPALPRLPTLHRPKDSDAVLAALELECGEREPVTALQWVASRIDTNSAHCAQ